MSSSLLLCAIFQTLIALRGQFTFHSCSQQVGEIGVRDRGRENDVSRRKPGVREFTEEREKAVLHEHLKSRRYKQQFLLAASLCFSIAVCMDVLFCSLLVECIAPV